MRFLVLGCNGMAGHTISLYLKEKGLDVFGFDLHPSTLIKSATGNAMDAAFVKELVGINTYFDHILVHTGQNYDYELNKVFFEELGLREPDYYLGVVGENLGQTMGNVISKSYELMQEVKPDALIVLGDTNSCLCVNLSKAFENSSVSYGGW